MIDYGIEIIYDLNAVNKQYLKYHENNVKFNLRGNAIYYLN